MNWNSITVETVGEGIRRQMVTGDRLMMCRLQKAPHTITPVHSHPHEQITIIEQGRVRFHVDGTDRIVSAGEILHFPSNVRHGATIALPGSPFAPWRKARGSRAQASDFRVSRVCGPQWPTVA